jgi:hypothetical protein
LYGDDLEKSFPFCLQRLQESSQTGMLYVLIEVSVEVIMTKGGDPLINKRFLLRRPLSAVSCLSN